jgi:hypothetical protein
VGRAWYLPAPKTDGVAEGKSPVLQKLMSISHKQENNQTMKKNII